MTLPEKEKQLRLQLSQDLALLRKSAEVLRYSYDQCRSFSDKSEFTPQEQEKMEALCARFARASDLLTQKIIKNILILLKEDVVTFIDRAYFLEKLQVIRSSQELIDTRALRNEIAHEYSSDINNLFGEIFAQSPILLDTIEKVSDYAAEKFGLTIE